MLLKELSFFFFFLLFSTAPVGMFSSENLNVWHMEKSTICSKSLGLLVTFVGNAYKLTGLELTRLFLHKWKESLQSNSLLIRAK